MVCFCLLWVPHYPHPASSVFVRRLFYCTHPEARARTYCVCDLGLQTNGLLVDVGGLGWRTGTSSSLFVMFEAIQRMWVAPLPPAICPLTVNPSLDPPEMNNSQPLLVSFLGLGLTYLRCSPWGHHHHVRAPHPHSLESTDSLIGTFALARWA